MSSFSCLRSSCLLLLFSLGLCRAVSLCVSVLILRSLRANQDRAVKDSEPRFMGRDLALPVRPGVISAVLALPRPLNPERRPPHRALSSPPKALRGPLHPQLLAPYWLRTRDPKG